MKWLSWWRKDQVNDVKGVELAPLGGNNRVFIAGISCVKIRYVLDMWVSYACNVDGARSFLLSLSIT